ncbi:DMT family transporter [uncultured Clostridium sp.]|uniref:DMT family transporter n=1 Tax=uncultured Clostridium sp. TaxID=59620 RepID=UPI0025D1D54A|nr:DMT family transporter [uncultured Clostridium sp.]
MIYILLSILTGVIIVVSRILNTRLSHEIGLIESSYFNYLTGAVTSIVLFLIMDEHFNFVSLKDVPLYGYLGGVLGVIIVILNSVVSPKLSAFYVTLLIFVGQLFTGVLIDWLIAGTLPLTKIFGGIIVVIGLSFNLLVDAKDAAKKQQAAINP